MGVKLRCCNIFSSAALFFLGLLLPGYSPFAGPWLQPFCKARVGPFPKAQTALHNFYSPLLLSELKVCDPWMYFSHIPNLNLQSTFSGTRWGGVPFRQAWASPPLFHLSMLRQALGSGRQLEQACGQQGGACGLSSIGATQLPLQFLHTLQSEEGTSL